MKTKRFHLGDVLSITTSKLVSPRLMVGVEDILSFMVGDRLFDFGLVMARDACGPYLLEQFPQLMEVDISVVDTENYVQWLADQVPKYGEWFEVKQISRHTPV